MKKALYKYFSWFAILVAALIVISAVLAACRMSASDTAIAKIGEIAALFDRIPLHPSKTQKSAHNKTSGGNASIART